MVPFVTSHIADVSASTEFLKHGAIVECGRFEDSMGPVRLCGVPTQLQQFPGWVGLNNWLNEWIMTSLILGHLSLKA